MIVINRSQRLLSIAAPGQGLGVLMLVPLARVEVPPELDEAVLAALEGPLRTYVAQGELDIEETLPNPTPSSAPPAAAPEVVGDTPIGIATEVNFRDFKHTPLELERGRAAALEPEPEPTPTPVASRTKRR